MKKNKTASRPVAGSSRLPARLYGMAALGAYFAVLLAGQLLNSHKMTVIAPAFINYINPLTYGIAWLVVAVILMAYGTISRNVVYGVAWFSAVGYAISSAMSGGSTALAFAMCGVVAVMTLAVGYMRRREAEEGGKQPRQKKEISPLAGKMTVGVVAGIGGGVTLFFLLSSYLSYTSDPSMSTGVYMQMMESLRAGFSFDTTLEFGQSVSHMAAHFSPIFLLYLPFYALIPSPVTLLVIQMILVYSAVIPLWLLARRRGLSVGMTTVVCGLMCFFPAVLGAISSSFHEYALLLPLLLWLMWAFETRRTVLVGVLAALVLCVRETAAIHLLTLALYWLIVNRKKAEGGVSRRRERITALVVAGVSLVYVVVALIVLTYAGKGTLITRFFNVTGTYGTSFGTLIREIIFNPALIFYEIFTESKFFYVLTLLLPLGLLPLLSRRRAGLVFLIPLVLLNLLSDYVGHFSTDYPYSFGMAAFLLLLTMEALSAPRKQDGKEIRTRRYVALAICFTLIIGGFQLAEMSRFSDYIITGRQEIAAMDTLLESVEDGASVSASRRLCPNLAGRAEIYTLSHEADTTYVVLDLREEWQLNAEFKYTVKHYEEKGYTVVVEKTGVGVILKK